MSDPHALLPEDRRVVVALGGNAFAGEGARLSMAGQFRFAREVATSLAPLLDREIAISHGNGPQVGHMLARVEQALGVAYEVPLEVCVAETEGELGYVIAQSLHNVLVDRGQPRAIATLLTQVIVDANDPAFARPDKPIGPFYDAARADALRQAGFALMEDAGRGYRRVVASPVPLEIVDATVIERLLQLGVVAIALGGGGIPVVRHQGRLRGVDAVIDKDRASSLLARSVSATLLVIVTSVPAAFLGYRSANPIAIERATPARLRGWLAEGHFAPGSMGPKIEAAAAFADRPGCRALICDPASLSRALAGQAGTWVSS